MTPPVGLVSNGQNEAAVPLRPELNFVQREPDSISSQGIALLGLGGFFVAWLIARQMHVTRPSLEVLVFLVVTALPMIMANLIFNKTYLRRTSGLACEASVPHWGRVRAKWIGLWSTLGLLAAFYRLVPEYFRSYYHPAWEIGFWSAPVVVALSLLYVPWVDCRMRHPCDGYWQAGLLMLGRWREVDWRQLTDYGLGWLVKGFFLPFILGAGAKNLDVLLSAGIDAATFDRLYIGFVNFIYTIDVIFGAVGYILTLRILDAQIQSVDRTLLGWLCTLCCYVPFSSLIWSTLLNYKSPVNWFAWLDHWPVVLITWGFAIMMLHVIYVWSTCSFGCRFSNLTNRGIVTAGPYRFVKHPAYWSKNLAWWLMAVPFIGHGTLQETVHACLCLLATNGIYAVRAWTEERHLMRDPAYGIYAQWISRNGLGSRILSLGRRTRASNG